MKEICLPQFGMGMTEGLITKWYKSVGDTIMEGELLCDIETAKTTVELQAPFSGTLATIAVPVDQSVPINTCIALVEDGVTVMQAAAGVQPSQHTLRSVAVDPASAPTQVQIEPRAREAARIHKVDLTSIRGSGPGGRIIENDVLALATNSSANNSLAKPHLRPGTDIPHTVIRRAIARRLIEAKQNVPHYYVRGTCTVDTLLNLRRDFNATAVESRGASINDFCLRAAALALRLVPEANVSWGEKAMRRHEVVDVAFAVDTPQGVVTPIVRDADKKDVGAISAETRLLIARARTYQLKPEEYLGGSATVSNLGMFGVEDFSAIINPPQAVIFALGAMQKRPVVTGERLTIATVMAVTLSADHRAVDGAVAAKLLSAFKSVVEGGELQ